MSKSTQQQPWTDEEYGFLQDRLDWSTIEVAALMGRSVSSVQNKKHRLRKGWSPTHEAYRAWLPEEDALILNNPHMKAADIARQMARTAEAVNQRRMLLRRTRSDVPSFLGNFSPFAPGARPLLAQTCPSCGLLLQEKWFQSDRSGRCRTCKRCRKSEQKARGVFPNHGDKAEGSYERQKERYRHWQNVTIERAENRGEPFTEKDLIVLADPDLTLFQKAIRLKRTWYGISNATRKMGFRNKRGLGDPERDQWHIDNPNAARVDEIRAQFEEMTAGIEHEAPEPVPSGAPARPEFEWDD